MCCGEVIVKYVLFIVNLLFALAGIVVIVLGAIVWNNLKDIQEIIPISFLAISIIVIGCIIFFIGFLACCGAIRESRCMLISYGICMIILAGIKIYLTVVIFTFLSDIVDTVSRLISNAFNDLNLRQVFYTLQFLFSCCGPNGPSSYGESTLPTSCCPSTSANATCIATNAHLGCNHMVTRWLGTFGEAIGGVLSIVIVFEIVAIILAFFMSHSIANKMRRANY